MEKLKTYLVGSIQDDEKASEWRNKLTGELEAMHLEVQDPCKLECNKTLAPSIEEQKGVLKNLKRSGQWKRFHEVMSTIRAADLTCVNNSKFIIVLFDVNKKMGGTIHEIIEAMSKHIPIYVVIEGTRMDANDWTLDLLITSELASHGTYTEKIFPNFSQLLDFIALEYKDYITTYDEFLKLEDQVAKAKGTQPEIPKT